MSNFPTLKTGATVQYPAQRATEFSTHFSDRAERCRIDAHQNLGPHATINRLRNFDPAAMQAQVANRPRHNHAARRERADLRLSSTVEAHTSAAIVIRSVLPVSHVYKIVRWGRFL